MAKAEDTIRAVDQVIRKMEILFEHIQAAQGSLVKLPKAELEMLEHFDVAIKCITEAMKDQGDRTAFGKVFGGSCTRVARIEALVNAVEFSDMNKGDQRKDRLLNACKSCNSVLIDLGFGVKVRAAQIIEEKALFDKLAVVDAEASQEGADTGAEISGEGNSRIFDEEEAEGDAKELTAEEAAAEQLQTHLAAAAVMEGAAIEADQERNFGVAVPAYKDCEEQLGAAAELADPENRQKLEKHQSQVLARITFLDSLVNGTEPEWLPVETHIGEVELQGQGMGEDEQSKASKRKRVLATCGAVGAGAGLLVLGPIGLSAGAVAAGMVAAGGAAGFVASKDDAKGKKAYGAGESLLQKGADKVASVAEDSRVQAALKESREKGKKIGWNVARFLGVEKQDYKDMKKKLRGSVADVNAKLDKMLGTNQGGEDGGATASKPEAADTGK